MSQLTSMANLPNDASNPSSVTVWTVYKPGSRVRVAKRPAVRNTSVECRLPLTCLPQLGFNRVAPPQKSILFRIYVANP